MFTTASVKQLCTEYGSELLSIDSVKEKFSRETKVTVQCCVPDCTEEVSKSVRNLFKSKNFGCKIHFKIFKGQKISETKNQSNLRAATNNDSGTRYTHGELCAMECKPTLFDICYTLKITNYHNLNKNAIIDAIIERQNELDRLHGVEETKEPADSVTDEHTVAEKYVDLMNESKTQHQCIVNETKEPESFEIVGKTVTSEIIDVSKDLKAQFLEKHFFFEYNGQIWTQANLVAEFLKYKDPACTIRDLVDYADKMHFKDFPADIKSWVNQHDRNSRLQQNTFFINDRGLSKVINRSNMPLATGKKRGLEEVYIASTLTYESKGIYKIGKSEDSKRRLKSMNTSRLPDDEMYLCHVARCYDALKTEKTIHDLLHKFRVVKYREFFKLDLAVLTTIVDNVCANSVNNLI